MRQSTLGRLVLERSVRPTHLRQVLVDAGDTKLGQGDMDLTLLRRPRIVTDTPVESIRPTQSPQ